MSHSLPNKFKRKSAESGLSCVCVSFRLNLVAESTVQAFINIILKSYARDQITHSAY